LSKEEALGLHYRSDGQRKLFFVDEKAVTSFVDAYRYDPHSAATFSSAITLVSTCVHCIAHLAGTEVRAAFFPSTGR
jgi:hypothetical protein